MWTLWPLLMKLFKCPHHTNLLNQQKYHSSHCIMASTKENNFGIFFFFFFFYYFFSALTWKSGLQTDALAVNKSPMMVFVVLFSSDCNLQAWLVQVDGGVDLLSVFKQWPFSKEQNWHVLSGSATTPVFQLCVRLKPVNSWDLFPFLLRCLKLQAAK